MDSSSDDEMVNVLEECRVSPSSVPPGGVEFKSLPLTLYDMPFLHIPHVKSLWFYKFAQSKTQFIDITIPSLKHSLSLALNHFYPFAGNLLIFPPPNLLKHPEFHYEDGDSVSMIFAECNSSTDEYFDYLTGDHPRKVSRFHPLIPKPPPLSVKHDTTTLVKPLLAIQVTLFPNSGISLGFTMDHSVADGNSFTRFVKLWATIHKFQGGRQPPSSILEIDEGKLAGLLPFYDRTTVKDPNNAASFFWQLHQKTKFEGHPPPPPTTNILATFVLREANIQRLKNEVAVRRPTTQSHVSSFTVACAYTWACLIKARSRAGEEVGEDELEHFIFMGDSRTRMDPPLPENYFGNCLVPFHVTAKSVELIDEDGFVGASDLIGGAIREKFGSGKEGVWEGIERWYRKAVGINRERTVGVSSSPKFAIYDTDFGLGELVKREVVSIDGARCISLHQGKANKRDIEVGLSLSKIKMDAFSAIFADGLSMYR